MWYHDFVLENCNKSWYTTEKAVDIFRLYLQDYEEDPSVEYVSIKEYLEQTNNSSMFLLYKNTY